MFKQPNKNRIIILGTIIVLSLSLLFIFSHSVLAQGSSVDPPLIPPPEPNSTPVDAKPPAESPATGAETPGAGTSSATGDTANKGGSITDTIVSGALGIFVIAIGMILGAITSLFGQLLILLIEVLVWISGYNSFINNDYVKQGWVILRDLVNMFFVLGLLFIAFVTVLKIEKYQWNKLLARLLIMAIVVNFSKTICGIIIDFFQVLMMTFVNAYKDIAAGNLMNAVGVTHWYQISKEMAKQTYLQGAGDPSQQLLMLAGQMLGLIFTIILCIVVVIFCIILAARIIALWILIVFSPLAFFSWIFEGSAGKFGEFSKQWWGQFLNYCMVGPFLAFFLWISVLTMAKLDPNNMVPSSYYDGAKRTSISATTSEAGSMDNVVKFMLTIVMLVGGLSQTQRFSVVGAGLAVGAANWMKDQSVGRIERGARKVGAGAAAVAKAPYAMAVKPRMAGMAEGISQRLQTGRIGAGEGSGRLANYTKLLTKGGREEYSKQRQAAYEKRYAGGGLRKLDVDNKVADEYLKNRSDIDKTNPVQVEEELEKMANLDKDKKFLSWKSGGDKRAQRAFIRSLAEQGTLSKKWQNAIKQEGGVVHDDMDLVERKKFQEDLENTMEEKTGREQNISDVIRNEDTQDNEDIAKLAKTSEDARENLITKGKSGGMSDKEVKDQLHKLDFGKVFKKKTDGSGTYELDTTSASFNGLDKSLQSALQDLEKQGTDDESDFYAFSRTKDIKVKKAREVHQTTATANTDKANKASQQIAMGDAANGSENAVAELNGWTYQTQKIGSPNFNQKGRDNIAAKNSLQFASTAERAKIIEANKDKFDKSWHQKNTETEAQYIDRLAKNEDLQDLDREVSGMSLQDLARRQNLQEITTSEYDAVGRKKEGTGKKDANIDAMIAQRRKAEDISSDIQNVAPNAAIADKINAKAGPLLSRSKKIQNPAQRRQAIIHQIAVENSINDSQAAPIADVLITNEDKITRRDRAVNESKFEFSLDLDDAVELAKNDNPNQINYIRSSIMQQIQNKATTSGIPESSFAKQELDKALSDLAIKIQPPPPPALPPLPPKPVFPPKPTHDQYVADFAFDEAMSIYETNLEKRKYEYKDAIENHNKEVAKQKKDYQESVVKDRNKRINEAIKDFRSDVEGLGYKIGGKQVTEL